VENEFEIARAKETEEGRDVICPITIDDAWATHLSKADHPNRVLWRKLKEKYVIDFSKWRTKTFEQSFRQLTSGIRLNYEAKIL
jgi:hypothetical protein